MADLGAEGTEDLDRMFLDSMQAAIQAMGDRIGGRKRPSDQMDSGVLDQVRETGEAGEDADSVFLELTGTSVPGSRRSTRRFARSTGLVTPGRSSSSRVAASQRAHQGHGSTRLGYPARSEQAASSSAAGIDVRQRTLEAESLASTTEGPVSPQASPWTSGETWEPLLPQLDDSPRFLSMAPDLSPVETDEYQQPEDDKQADDAAAKEITTEQMTTPIPKESWDSPQNDLDDSKEGNGGGGLSEDGGSGMGSP